MSSKPPASKDLAATALYTSATWAWGKLAHAKLLDWVNARLVFRITNFLLWITGKGGKLPYALLHRHVLMDRLLEQSGARRVLELAAGAMNVLVPFCVTTLLSGAWVIDQVYPVVGLDARLTCHGLLSLFSRVLRKEETCLHGATSCSFLRT